MSVHPGRKKKPLTLLEMAEASRIREAEGDLAAQRYVLSVMRTAPNELVDRVLDEVQSDDT